jgi:hypothetical protein
VGFFRGMLWLFQLRGFEEECAGLHAVADAQFLLASRTVFPTSANNVDSDGGATRVGFIHHAKKVLVFPTLVVQLCWIFGYLE